jgi:hypothetical protein
MPVWIGLQGQKANWSCHLSDSDQINTKNAATASAGRHALSPMAYTEYYVEYLINWSLKITYTYGYKDRERDGGTAAPAPLR